jgi:predicted negative regulator of RcsB-dependent stress response
MRIPRLTGHARTPDTSRPWSENLAEDVRGHAPVLTEGAFGMTDLGDTQHELELALRSFTEALGLVDASKDPGYYGIILHDIADAHVAAGNLQQAVAAYSDAMTYKLKRQPVHAGDLATTMEALADCLIDCGEPAEARATLSKLRDILPQIVDQTERAIHLHGVGRAYERLAGEGQDTYSEALGAYKEAAQLVDRDVDPGFYGVIMHDIGDTQLACGNSGEAIAAYRDAVAHKLKRVPGHPSDLATTMLALCDCLLESGEPGEARAILSQVHDLLPQIEEPGQRAIRLHRMGAAFERLAERGQPEAYTEALAAYKDALKLLDATADPATYATVLNDIGDVYKAQEKYSDARDAYEQAVEYMRKIPAEKYHLASMLIDLGRIRLQIINSKHEPANSSHKAGQASSSADAQLADAVIQPPQPPQPPLPTQPSLPTQPPEPSLPSLPS